ncbi:unnamed protein product [Mytilus coruscus]|uniref:Uncharacterized protein n=1 Tax=Mytilus coruscus TaxID=42192 RepID=A0A6J8D0V8_MYTCO|nr:unnamed protein product [Mytilus coruscus]
MTRLTVVRVLSNNKITSVPGGVLENSSALTYIYCKECFDCDCLSASTYQWITIIVKGLEEYEFTCRNGVALPNTVVNCSELDSAYTNIAGIISGMVASLTLITIFTALRRFSNTMSRINDSDMTDTEVNKTINDGIDFIPTIDGEMAKKYNNIPPNNHMILSSFSHIPSIPNIMDSERNSTTGKSDLCHEESSEL